MLWQVTADMATQNILAGPKEVADGLRLNHELVNTPSAGVPGNAFFGANQLNLAPAERVDSGTFTYHPVDVYSYVHLYRYHLAIFVRKRWFRTYRSNGQF